MDGYTEVDSDDRSNEASVWLILLAARIFVWVAVLAYRTTMASITSLFQPWT
ncbi:MAG: hypothetical protein ACUVQG_06800 [Thermogutta sp.]